MTSHIIFPANFPLYSDFVGLAEGYWTGRLRKIQMKIGKKKLISNFPRMRISWNGQLSQLNRLHGYKHFICLPYYYHPVPSRHDTQRQADTDREKDNRIILWHFNSIKFHFYLHADGWEFCNIKSFWNGYTNLVTIEQNTVLDACENRVRVGGVFHPHHTPNNSQFTVNASPSPSTA